jgi:hypothetical protein
MEAGVAVQFEKGAVYTRAQIRAALGGSVRAALPTRRGRVVCACLTHERNPRAPGEMIVGNVERAIRLARDFAASGAAVPVFVRVRPGGWEYAGERRVRALIEEPGALLALVAEGAQPDIGAALQLEEIARPSSGSGGSACEPPSALAAAGGAEVCHGDIDR